MNEEDVAKAMPKIGPDLRIRLANLCHEQWSGWMEYLFSKCATNSHNELVIPRWAVERWSRQMTTPFSQLPPDEQDSDIKEAMKFLDIFDDWLQNTYIPAVMRELFGD